MNIIKVLDPDYDFLSPDYLCSIRIIDNDTELKNFHSLQQAYQYTKTYDLESRDMLMSMTDPVDVYKFGQKTIKRNDWHGQKYFQMQRLLKLKFTIPELGQLLINTGIAIIEFDNEVTDYWGQIKGRGNNIYGKQLMHLRDDLIKRELDKLSYAN